MKHKNIVALFLIGVAIIVAGVVMKFMEWDGAKIVLLAGLFIEGLSGVLLWLRMRKGNDDSQGFLDQ